MYPGLYDLFKSNICDKVKYKFKVIGIGRSNFDNISFHKLINKSLEKNWIDNDGHNDKYNYDENFLQNFSYIQGYYNDIKTYLSLFSELQKYNGDDKLIIYCGVPDYVSINIIECIKISGIYDKYSVSFLVEKPFGSNLETYIEYQNRIKNYINEQDFKLIDHYRCKSSIKNMKSINELNSTILRNNTLKLITITLFETENVEHRLEYFDRVGILNDVFQSHIMSIIDKLISKEYQYLKLPQNDGVNRGQYINYGGSKDTETFVQIRLNWKDIQIYIEFGKKMQLSKKNIRFISDSENIIELEVKSDKNEYFTMFNSEIIDTKNDYYLSDIDNRLFWKITNSINDLIVKKDMMIY